MFSHHSFCIISWFKMQGVGGGGMMKFGLWEEIRWIAGLSQKEQFKQKNAKKWMTYFSCSSFLVPFGGKIDGTFLHENLLYSMRTIELQFWKWHLGNLKDPGFYKTWDSGKLDLSSLECPWAICHFTFALGASGGVAIIGQSGVSWLTKQC